MMKKILLFSTLIAAVIACKPSDDPIIEKTYPTDGLPLEEQKNVLVLTGIDSENSVSALFEYFRLQNEDEYKGDLNTMSFLTTPYGNLFSSYADSIMMNFQSPFAPYFVVNGQEVFFSELDTEIKRASRQKPLLAVAHAVSSNDTAWIVDNKVKFFNDTTSDDINIDTYMLIKLKAREYKVNSSVTIDLKMMEQKDLIKNPALPLPRESQWDLNVVSKDSSKTLVSKGSSYYYDNILLEKFDSVNVWGTSIGSYWPFNGEFYKGDIIGTKDTPIRHYFKKPAEMTTEEQPFEYDIKFLTIVWVRNPSTGSYEYVNSYSTGKLF